jgi:hypothetical protein
LWMKPGPRNSLDSNPMDLWHLQDLDLIEQFGH